RCACCPGFAGSACRTPEGLASAAFDAERRLMATTTQTFDAPAFSRITETKASAWTLGLPVGFILVALLIGLAYFASQASAEADEVARMQREAAQQQQATTAIQGKLTALESELQMARNPGEATVTLQPAKGTQEPWGSAVWGESGGKGFVQLRVYGLKPAPTGKQYQVWFQGAGAEPALVGTVDPGPNGAAYVDKHDLAGADAGGRLFVTLGDEPQGGRRRAKAAPRADARRPRTRAGRGPAREPGQGRLRRARRPHQAASRSRRSVGAAPAREAGDRAGACADAVQHRRRLP